jgi:hypothetical protein
MSGDSYPPKGGFSVMCARDVCRLLFTISCVDMGKNKAACEKVSQAALLVGWERVEICGCVNLGLLPGRLDDLFELSVNVIFVYSRLVSFNRIQVNGCQKGCQIFVYYAAVSA